MATTSSTRICPDCGAENNDGSLFCAECGSSLNTVPVSGNSHQSPAWSSQATQPYQPVAARTTQTTTTVRPDYAPVEDTAYAVPNETRTGYVPVEESVRGLILGWIAMILMLAIIGFFVWSTMVGDGFRDRFTNLF